MKTKIKSHYNYFGWIKFILDFLSLYAAIFLCMQLMVVDTTLKDIDQINIFNELNKFSGRFTILYLICVIILTYIGLRCKCTSRIELIDKVLYEYELKSKKLKNYSEKLILNKEVVKYCIDCIISIFFIIFCIIPFIIIKLLKDVYCNIKNIKWSINFVPWMALTITILAIVFLVYYIKRSVNNK